MVPPEPPTLSPADLIGGRYRLTRRIARGGMAEVWEADDIILSRPVAVKALLPRLASDQAFVIRFRREAVAAARLAHPNIVSIYDTCSQPGCEAIVMELVRGRTLRDELDEQHGMDMAQAVDIAIQVAGALEHAHLHGLVHRDVKPANILLGGDGRVLVADFGIAKALRPGDLDGLGPDASDQITIARRPATDDRHADGHRNDLTAIGDVMGTAKYLAPEQVQGQPVDARVDVYALGIVLYEMLCGRPPFVGIDASTTATARLTDEPLRPRQVRAGIPRQLEDITLRALARDPGARYPSAGAFKAALTSVDLSPFEVGSPEPTTTFAYDRGRAGRTAYEVGDGYAGPERTWLVPAALIVVIAVTLGAVGVLVGRTDVGRGLFESVGVTSGNSRPVAVDSATSFDPLGDRKENDDQVRFVVDDDPGTSWRTENYFNSSFGGLKAGVGVVLHVPPSTNLQTLLLTSPTRGWSASVYVGDGRASSIAGWGQPVGSVSAEQSRDDSVSVGLGDRKAEAVLVWITNLGDSSNSSFRFELQEAALRG